MPGISENWSKFALLKFKLSTCSAVFRCQGGKGDDPLASSQLFRGSCNIYLCLVVSRPWIKEFFRCFLMSVFPTPLRTSSQAALFFQMLLEAEDPPQRVPLQLLTPPKLSILPSSLLNYHSFHITLQFVIIWILLFIHAACDPSHL